MDLNKAGPGAEHPDDELLEDARMAASSQWAEDFVADQLERRKEYGANFTLSDRQRATLRTIAGHDKP